MKNGVENEYGEIAQLARARGSYPRCRGFESPSRYFIWDLSSAGRASALQAEGHRFEPCSSHQIGLVVQLVRTLPCHGRGRGFESHPDRHCGFSSSGRAPPCQGGGSEFEPRHPLQKGRLKILSVLFS